MELGFSRTFGEKSHALILVNILFQIIPIQESSVLAAQSLTNLLKVSRFLHIGEMRAGRWLKRKATKRAVPQHRYRSVDAVYPNCSASCGVQLLTLQALISSVVLRQFGSFSGRVDL